ncbi:MAG: TrkA family potassium uptake protein [Deltaproteobacteria bacterium]|nr:TrkA family potassium uptake protein [Candidatus Anaeroferrophillus wilburensis]MBN2888070.1 TrkA family potassium uptake protein [Deltaproteobacteria bacterium]
MYIIIAGGGISATSLANVLAHRKDDVVIIEKDRERCEQMYAETGMVTINGSATDIGTLKEAGIEKAAVAIGALYRDSDNLTFAILARSFQVPRIMVKMRDPAYVAAFEQAGVTTICNMNELFQNKIMMELENPDVRIVTHLGGVSTQLIMIRYPEYADPAGITIQDLSTQGVFAKDCVFAGILNEKTEKIVMPRGHDKVFPGDRLFLVVDQELIPEVSGFLAAKSKRKHG